MTGPTDEATETLVHDVRAVAAGTVGTAGADIALTGQTAVGIDVSEKLADALPVYLLLVVGLSVLLLALVFRSVLVPIKAALGFLLTVGATFGITVLVFQEGHLAGLLGVDTPGPLVSFLPILLIGILFGLAMDYEVFLVSRMREDFVHGDTAQQATVNGMGHGARVVTAAALIMTSVFAGFMLIDDPIIKSMGFALALGVVIDAFVVRMTIVPAVMSLLGRAGWWLPRWLSRVLPNVDLEGAALERHGTHAAASRSTRSPPTPTRAPTRPTARTPRRGPTSPVSLLRVPDPETLREQARQLRSAATRIRAQGYALDDDVKTIQERYPLPSETLWKSPHATRYAEELVKAGGGDLATVGRDVDRFADDCEDEARRRDRDRPAGGSAASRLGADRAGRLLDQVRPELRGGHRAEADVPGLVGSGEQVLPGGAGVHDDEPELGPAGAQGPQEPRLAPDVPQVRVGTGRRRGRRLVHARQDGLLEDRRRARRQAPGGGQAHPRGDERGDARRVDQVQPDRPGHLEDRVAVRDLHDGGGGRRRDGEREATAQVDVERQGRPAAARLHVHPGVGLREHPGDRATVGRQAVAVHQTGRDQRLRRLHLAQAGRRGTHEHLEVLARQGRTVVAVRLCGADAREVLELLADRDEVRVEPGERHRISWVARAAVARYSSCGPCRSRWATSHVAVRVTARPSRSATHCRTQSGTSPSW